MFHALLILLPTLTQCVALFELLKILPWKGFSDLDLRIKIIMLKKALWLFSRVVLFQRCSAKLSRDFLNDIRNTDTI